MHLSLPWHKHRVPAQYEGQAARERAEAELARIRAETPYYAGLGQDLRDVVDRNHIAENIRRTLRQK